jgi:hypothetical protein
LLATLLRKNACDSSVPRSGVSSWCSAAIPSNTPTHQHRDTDTWEGATGQTILPLDSPPQPSSLVVCVCLTLYEQPLEPVEVPGVPFIGELVEDALHAAEEDGGQRQLQPRRHAHHVLVQEARQVPHEALLAHHGAAPRVEAQSSEEGPDLILRQHLAREGAVPQLEVQRAGRGQRQAVVERDAHDRQ